MPHWSTEPTPPISDDRCLSCFDVKQFETVSAKELDYTGIEFLPEAQRMSISPIVGPRWVYAEPPADPEERQKIMAETLGGGPEFKNLPRLFRPWPHGPTAIRAALRAIETLRGEAKDVVLERLAGLGLEPSEAGFVSLLGGSGSGNRRAKEERSADPVCGTPQHMNA